VSASEAVFADSTTLAQVVQRCVPGTPVRIVRFGIDLDRPVRMNGVEWRRRLKLADGAFMILSSRLVRPAYNIDTIIQALPSIRRELPGAVLVLKELPRFSDAAYRNACLELAATLGVRDAVRTVGETSRDELLALQAAADVYVSVPTNDGTAVSVLEAMAAGAAVVATDVPGIDPAILHQEQTALLVPRRDPEALAAAVVRLGRNERLRRRIVGQARRVVERHGDFSRELDRAVLLYEELVSARTVSSRRPRSTCARKISP
jgi:glycosyltransferase involved in cell wall biosynthesis